MADVRIQDNTGEVMRRMKHAIESALVAMAVESQKLIQEEIMSGYGDPIWDSGDLHGSIKFDMP